PDATVTYVLAQRTPSAQRSRIAHEPLADRQTLIVPPSLRSRAALAGKQSALSLLLLRRRGRRRREDVLVEPLQVVLHDGTARLRLRRAVADAVETFIDDQLRRHPDVLQSAV